MDQVKPATRQPRYTSLNQFANMLEKRATELEELAERIRDELSSADIAEDLLSKAVCQLHDVATLIRERFRGPNLPPDRAA